MEFIASSSRDRRGRRVLVRDSGVENVIYQSDGVTEADIALLGITETDRKHIERFIGGEAL